jgi:hypothetical protein
MIAFFTRNGISNTNLNKLFNKRNLKPPFLSGSPLKKGSQCGLGVSPSGGNWRGLGGIWALGISMLVDMSHNFLEMV